MTSSREFNLTCRYYLFTFHFITLSNFKDLKYTSYADRANAYWTGYFSSRPALKRYVRMMSGYYLVLFMLLVLVCFKNFSFIY